MNILSRYNLNKLDYRFIIIVILILALVGIVYYSYSCFFPSMNQRIWPITKLPKHTEFITFVADSMLEPGILFQFNMPTEGFQSIFKSDDEKEKMKQDAINYFKEQFGLSETFITTLMREIRVNDAGGYKAESVKSNPNLNGTHVIDGGYAAYIPPGTTLYGRYGGKTGVKINISGVLAYGYYIINDYKILYKSPCPLQSFKTYDADYNPIDCDVEVVSGTNTDLIGLKGKAIGVMRTAKLNNGKDHITIRNVLSLD